jgi:cbb3-type cytochrome oxidase subunit 3
LIWCVVSPIQAQDDGSFRSLAQKLERSKSVQEATEEVEAAGKEKDLGPALQAARQSGDLQAFTESVRLRANFEDSGADSDRSPSPVAKADPKEAVKQIKSDPLFKKLEREREGNWLSKAFTSLKPENIEAQPQSLNLGGALTVLVWVLLGALALLFLGTTVWFFATRARSQRRVSAVLEEDEPLRSSDEWLALGRAAEQVGDGRAAVRAYYLAGLLRLDELSVLRFERTETNWQHLRRLGRVVNGADFGFTDPTRRFDEIWFGDRPVAAGELDLFRKLASQVEQVARA